MFIENQDKNNIKEYYDLLKIMGSLSRLYSDNNFPYIDYRVAENLFCMCLKAKNLSRSDCSADATKNDIGIGIKTFLNTQSNSSLQKIAEFNSKRNEYAILSPSNLIRKVSILRNERIEVTKRLHGLNSILYHCVIRDEGKIYIVENNMDSININNLYIIKSSRKSNNTINFTDGKNEYNFNLSKSVLSKRFNTSDIIQTIYINILDEPYRLLKNLLYNDICINLEPLKLNNPYIYLPLYSEKKGIKYVPTKSGLNQWSASGRTRNENEVYIPIPIAVHRKSPDFFPSINEPFNLILPDGKILSAKVCQDNSKALMSNPNSELGLWLLRHILQVKVNELVTYEMLESLGIDSVIITKKNKSNYTIDFTSTGKYQQYISST